MSGYVRPPLPPQLFYDSDGAVIPYGRRWRGRSPPEDTYSVVSNPHRFAPLLLVAQALIDHLASSYAVSVSEDPAFAADLLSPRRDDVVRAVRVVPDNPDEAALTFVFTSFPGIAVHAGLLHDFPFPDCGCDACDETAEDAADELEQVVFSVVAGGFAESVDFSADGPIAFELSYPDGLRRGARTSDFLSPAWLEQAAERLRRLPGGRWQPWTPLGADGTPPHRGAPRDDLLQREWREPEPQPPGFGWQPFRPSP